MISFGRPALLDIRRVRPKLSAHEARAPQRKPAGGRLRVDLRARAEDDEDAGLRGGGPDGRKSAPAVKVGGDGWSCALGYVVVSASSAASR